MSGASSGSNAACPDERGTYVIVPIDVTGCGGTLGTKAPECIRQSACVIQITSAVTAGSKPGVSGTADLLRDGNFTGAAITEGLLARTGCTGTWDAATSTLTIDCGGKGMMQSCGLALKRTAATCN